MRRRDLAQAGAKLAAVALPADTVAELGLSETELTPQVRTALAALAIELEHLRGEVSQLKASLAEAEAQADQDVLTSAKNRRALVRELKRIGAFVQRYRTPASLIYFDVDALKTINDRFGHAAGDTALKAVADGLAKNVRGSDLVARLGGDEFGVLLAQADAETAAIKAEALARAIESAPIAAGEWLSPIRLSWGVRLVDPAVDPETLIADADAAMFEMKRARAGAA
jgi:diguanylate cyclase (GGDEF)-like protein